MLQSYKNSFSCFLTVKITFSMNLHVYLHCFDELNSSDLIGEYGTTLRGPKVGPLFQSNVISPS